MAKKNDGAVPAAAGVAAADTVKSGDVKSGITKGALQNILTIDRKNKKKQSELAGELGQEIANAVERFGVNRKALGVIRSLNRMEAEQIADFLDHLDHMLDISGIEELAKSVEKLPMDGGMNGKADGDEAGDGVDTVPGDEKVSRPRFGSHGGGGNKTH